MDEVSLHRGGKRMMWRYNSALPETDAKAKAAHARVMRAETVGLLVLALLIFGMILVRWGHLLDWHIR